MKHSLAHPALIALALCLSAGAAWAADPQPQASTPSSPAHRSMAAHKSQAALPQVAPVDINSATKAELKKLPGIGDAEADKIIAGRPYLTKAHLQTRNVVSPLVYQSLRHLVVARQKDSKFAKPVRK